MTNRLFRSLVLFASIVFSYSTAHVKDLFELKQTAQFYPKNVLDLTDMVCKCSLRDKKIAIVGANKSQGGQTIVPFDSGVRINLSFINKLIDLNVYKKTVTVQAGMTWAQLQNIIAPHALSIRAMQSYADFAIGASLSVNVHGQDLANNPLIKSVESFKLINSDGQIINVSRSENSELFGLAIGGYGLFGIIVEVTLYLTDNALLERQVDVIQSDDFVNYFENNVLGRPDIEFYSARFDMSSKNFMDNVIVVSYKKTDSNNQDLGSISKGSLRSELINKVAKYAILTTSKIKAFKDLRMSLEKFYFKSGGKILRNDFMSFPLSSLPQDDVNNMYILQEYFIPYNKVNSFIKSMKAFYQGSGINLLNVTMRHVNADTESFLSYSPVDTCAFVLYIKVSKKEAEYKKIANLTSKLIDFTIDIGGKYYLPYQLLGSKAQISKIYPQWNKFIDLKHKYDSKDLFVNSLYLKYQ